MPVNRIISRFFRARVKLRSRRDAGLLLLLPCLLVLTGCVTQRGVDFGHWAKSSERIDIIKFIGPPPSTPLSGNRIIAVLPAIGEMPQPYLDQLNNNLVGEARLYFKTPIAAVERDGKFSQYVTRENVMPIDGIFNSREIARLGLLMGVSHILCCQVTEYRLHPPQLISLHFVLVECASFSSILEMNAEFDASEQMVLMALDRYMQRRSSRKYTRSSLDIILRSPSEYGEFVSAECMSTIAGRIWSDKKTLKERVRSAD